MRRVYFHLEGDTVFAMVKSQPFVPILGNICVMHTSIPKRIWHNTHCVTVEEEK